MTTGIRFLVAARRAEIRELEQLAVTSELVSLIGELVHGLQKERGLSNVTLGSRGQAYATQRERQAEQVQALERRVRERFESLAAGTDGGLPTLHGARLLSRIAVVLHALDALTEVRRQIAARAIGTEASTAAFVRAVAGLLAVVFQAADSAGDPALSRSLVALFHFMQGKEFAGQERALGIAVFSGASPAPVGQWAHLIEQQERCFEVFAAFADDDLVDAWRRLPQNASAAIERMRRLGCTARTDSGGDADLGTAWFDACTERIDAMRPLEQMLAVRLRRLGEARIAQARDELRDEQAILDALHREASAGGGAAPAAIGPRLEQSLLEMLQQQSRRLQAMGDELESVRAALTERKVVERAKGLLMASRQLSEDEAYKLLRQTAMNQHRKLTEVAASVLAMAEFL
jgi:hypothetical protein